MLSMGQYVESLQPCSYEYVRNSGQDDPQVQPERPFIDVANIQHNHLFEVQLIVAADLP